MIFRLRLLFTVCVLSACIATPRHAHAYNIFLDTWVKPYDHIVSWLSSWGNNTVTTVSDYRGEDLSRYDVVWDMDFDSYHLLTNQAKSAYTTYLNHGGGLYLTGERPIDTYLLNNTSVLGFLEELGSGTILYDPRDIFTNDTYPYEHAVPGPVTQNTSLTYLYDTSLLITDPGNGFMVVRTNEFVDRFTNTVYNGNFTNIIGFDRNQLINAPKGRVIAHFDITGLNVTDMFENNKAITREMISFLGENRDVTILAPDPIPEPSTLALFGGGVALLVPLLRYGRQTKAIERQGPVPEERKVRRDRRT